jgi:predicted MPP superfamily phosphohydrolase
VSLFLTVFFMLYAGLHGYAFIKARSAFAFGPGTAVTLALFMLIMLFMPFIIHSLEKYDFDAAARPAAFAGYTWMGVLFLFCSVAVSIDCCRFAVRAAGFFCKRNVAHIYVSDYHLFMAALIISFSIALYGYFEANNITTERIIIKTPKISREQGRIRIVQISDVHLGLIVREEQLKRILAVVKKAGPDIFVSTGDLVDGQISRLNGLAAMLREIAPRYGKFAITGNHEFYAGIDQSLNFTKEAGFTILSGSSALGPITIAGVDDPAAKAFGLSSNVSEKTLLQTLPGNTFVLLLKHRPLVNKDSTGLFDLQLSGHVHKGQIFHFSILTKIYYPVYAGYKKLPGKARLYVSRGSGTWGPPIRFLAPPEVTIIDLYNPDGYFEGSQLPDMLECNLSGLDL